MTTTNHWGMWVDSEVPITGVISNNSVEFLNDEICDHKAIDLDFEAYADEYVHDEDDEDDEENFDEYLSEYEPIYPTILIGDWTQDEDGLWGPDFSGEYSAIVREDVTQVVFSHTFKRCSLCSPCYPGQGDLDSDGEFLVFQLPESVLGEQE